MPTLNGEQSRAVAKLYSGLATSLRDYRFDHWTELTKAQRAEIESHEWTLLTISSNMTTHAIQLAVADVAGAVAGIMRATRRLAASARRIATVKRALALATAAIALGGAIASGHALAIGDAVTSALDVADG
jgi:hypothetical protein